MTAGSSAAGAGARGLPIRVIAPFATQPYTFVSRPDVPTLADLRGKVIGEDKPGAGDENFYVAAVLQKAGLSPTDVQVLSVGVVTAIYPALLSGQIAAGPLAAPLTEQAEAQGYHALADASVMPTPASGLATNLATLQGRPEVVQAALDGLLDAMVWCKESSDACTAYLAQKFNLDPALAASVYTDAEAGVRVSFSTEDLQGVIDRALASDQSGESASVADVYDLPLYQQFVQEGQQRGIQ